jgi:hypothetical protein
MTDTLQSYRQDLAIKGFSPKTQATYFACVRKRTQVLFHCHAVQALGA